MLPLRHWHEMTTTDFRDGNPEGWIAVQPVCAIEQHGPHLPLYTDTCIAEGMIGRVLELLPEDLPVTFLPTQAVGKSGEHISSPGTLTFEHETLAKMLVEIGASVRRAGLSKLILMSSHGGNGPVFDTAALELRLRHDMLCIASSWSRLGYPEGLFPAEEIAYGIHGGDIETSLMLHLRPDLVRMEAAADFGSAQREFAQEFKHLRAYGPTRFGWKTQDLNPEGALGNAAAATAEKGEAVVGHQAAAFVDLCRDVHAFDIDRLWTP